MPGFTSRPVDQHFDGVILALIEIEIVLKIHQFAVDPGACVAVLEQRFHFF